MKYINVYKSILIILMALTGITPLLKAETIINKSNVKKVTKDIRANFYFLGFKFAYGTFTTGVDIQDKEDVKVTHLGLRYMLLFNTGNYTTLGIMGDFFYSKRGYKLFENGFFSNEKKITYYGGNISFTVKHKWFYFGVGYEAMIWDKQGDLTFEHKEFEHFLTLTAGYVSAGKIKFFIGIEIKSALFKLDNFTYSGQSYSPGENSMQEYLVSIGFGF